MKKNIILAGVGGQGILSIAAIIGTAAVSNNMYVKQAEVHGMSQRGGDVQSHLRISDNEIFSDLIPLGKADIVISVEPLEALRYVPFLSNNGWIVSNTNPVKNIPNYPEIENVISEIKKITNNKTFDANALAKDAGNTRAMNMVVLGAASPYIGLSEDSLKNAIKKVFSKKGEDIVNLNLKAFDLGKNTV